METGDFMVISLWKNGDVMGFHLGNSWLNGDELDIDPENMVIIWWDFMAFNDDVIGVDNAELWFTLLLFVT